MSRRGMAVNNFHHIAIAFFDTGNFVASMSVSDWKKFSLIPCAKHLTGLQGKISINKIPRLKIHNTLFHQISEPRRIFKPIG